MRAEKAEVNILDDNWIAEKYKKCRKYGKNGIFLCYFAEFFAELCLYMV